MNATSTSGPVQAAGSTAEQSGTRPRPVLLVVVNVGWYFNLHRAKFASAALRAGWQVHVATAADSPVDIQRITEAGFVFHPLKIRRGRWRPLEELRLTFRLVGLQRRLRPDIVHNITIKPVLFGTLAARLAGTRAIVNAMSGLGFVFTASSLVAALRRAAVLGAYRVLFASRHVSVVFENSDDSRLFISRGIVRRSQAVTIHGVGVDLSRFPWRAPRPGVPLIVLPARMLWDKGVGEFCQAAAVLRAEGLQARFALVGSVDAENPTCIAQAWLEDRHREGAIEYWGHRTDMAAVYAQAAVVCLPSYREGLPTVLLEAAASGCALVTTDVPGCREVVQDGQTGLLVPARDVLALAAALRRIIGDPQLLERLASAAHAAVAERFSEERIIDSSLALYDRMVSPSFRSRS